MDYFGKIIVGIISWINTLLGRTKSKIPLQTSGQPAQKTTPDIPADSVTQDIQNLKSFVGKNKEKFLSRIFPNQGIGRKFIGIFIKLTLVIIFILTVVFVATKLFKNVSQNGRIENGVAETPTPLYYRPFKPSLWADDPEIKRLDEEINVLEREISGTNIKESSLNPPSLDFDIDFEGDN